MATSTVTVTCGGNDGIATGNFRLKLNTSSSALAAVKVSPP